MNQVANLSCSQKRIATPDQSRRIALIVQQPFAQNDFPKFEVDTMLEAGIEIDIYDLSPLMFAERWAQSKREPFPSDITYRAISSGTELRSLHNLLDQTSLTICGATTGHLSPANLPVMREVSKAQTPYMIIYRNAIPNIDKVYARPGIALRLKRLSIRNSLLNRMPLSLLGVRPADVVVRGGEASRIPMRLVGDKTEEIWSFSESFQECRADLNAVPEVEETGTAVYLDQNFGYHPDPLEHIGHKTVDPNKVYPLLRRWFDRVEQVTNLRVVIAGHPRANYDDIPDIFGAREIKFGETVRLVRQSSLVICNYSTAVNQAVWFKRPINIIQLPELGKMVNVADAPSSLAAAIAKPAIDISNPDGADLSNVMDVDQAKYDDFIERYIVSSKSPRSGIAETVGKFFAARLASPGTPQAQEVRT